ncbi:adenylate/guanylate cyclase domain-containing protein [Mucilaginibacter sp. UC70_90]
MNDFLNGLWEEISDCMFTDINTTKTNFVPTRNDTGLSFSRGESKKGKILETCVLFIDIRNSTRISRRLRDKKAKLGQIYSAFIHSMSRIADEYGFVRNIVGDRVMVVFEPENCFEASLECAATMLSVAVKMLRPISGLEEFKVGIGVDFGELLILKAGISKRHEEQSEYKNLIWVGDAANYASKLTDFASKEYNATSYKITYEYLTYEKVIKKPLYPLTNAYLNLGNPKPPEWEYKSQMHTSVATLTEKEFSEKVTFQGSNAAYEGKKILDIKKEKSQGIASSILTSTRVLDGVKKTNPKSVYFQHFVRKTYPEGPLISSGIYGGSYIINDLKLFKP